MRMGWDQVGDFQVFVYTYFLDHFKFRVRVVIGEEFEHKLTAANPKNAQICYEKYGLDAHWKVRKDALEVVKNMLEVSQGD